ncbi:xanthine/CO dehydrogenase XdhC/CoxF family maturation factor [Melghirimyces profundicolus]|uniref:Xanthine/CO dehydrogenase XdhC/CoxF family maturation factor n=1 Tax=Melghirimyces profundicolus TaxID=1242148 RepID=A0A2T6C0E8_9BACL|nr:XdhC/CoxI family protein [Melghirimyces profundicolus]PTX61803.1 xanthine/CO dehydrogenase XdhC/CoxF family maturation factor [Melghirimyces profundicolus]
MVDLYKELKLHWDSKTPAVVATIIDTGGSTYRQVGAKSLILNSGRIIGTLSGGCVEEDIYEHAQSVLQEGAPRTIKYDFRGEGDLLWGLGLGCNGSLSIWLQPFDPVRNPSMAKGLLNVFRKQLTATAPFSVMTVIQSEGDRIPPGTQRISDRQNGSVHTEGWEEAARVASCLREADRSKLVQVTMKTHKGERINVACYIETMKPVPRLLIFGGGADALPLVKKAKLLDWHVTVVDHRPEYANSKRFPPADRVVLLPRGEFVEGVAPDKATSVVIMTHHYQQDRLFLGKLLPYPFPYLGVLGPRKRTEKLLRDIESQGVPLTKGMLEKLHAPVGLDIGAETPEEIALSILSEVVASRSGRSGRPLRLRKGPIHERVPDPVGVEAGI